ncbi:MerR family transcriptional regulator [uncultured Rikenella sp.]|uniref:MerR family transcriptional regulator n=1 Tax=uncultured Rikenella sp. TaxID=368003 RepID=UPI002614ED3D|nr:MerR family transcriptional regulator [uncultured Rikenella sp.]
MTDKKKGSRKMFFSMGEVSEMFDVNPSLIRFWEKRFDVLKPKKNAKGNRLFTPEDIENLKLIYHLVKEKGMTLAGAEKYIKDNKNSLKRDVQILEHLGRIRAALLEIKTELGAESTDTEIVLRTEALAEAVNEALPAEAEVEMAEETEEVVVAEAEVSSSEERETPEEKGAEKPRYIEPTLFDF